nr:dihydroorotase [bacterium]
MDVILRGGRVVDPANHVDAVMDIGIENGRIAAVAPHLEAEGAVLDAGGMWVTPGLIDMHVHLREPGYEYKEDVASGTRAAVAGGFTSVCCMANTNPVADNAAVVRLILERARQSGMARVYPIGAATKGLKGQELTEMGELAQEGCVAFSDDGKPIQSGQTMRLAMVYAGAFGRFIISHAEEVSLLADGLMNEGVTSTVLGLKGITRAAEEAMVARDCILSHTLGLRVHIAHVSTRGAADIIRHYKALGAPITAETAPHYLCGTEEMCMGYSGNARVNPPLRTEDDRQAMLEALLDGTIDAIASDHAPHHRDEKQVEFALAANGISGLETSFALCKGALVDSAMATPAQLIGWMSARPAAILGLEGGTLSPGAPADIAVFDPDMAWKIDPEAFYSRGHNTPFAGREVAGKPLHVFVGGRQVLQNGKVMERG